VIDLQIEAGRVRSLVSGSDIYEVDISIKPLAKKRWADIKGRCAGQIDSLVELLRGSISKGVMEIVTRKGEGLFPSPREITLSCSCPDWATMCKHVAATLYGVGARLDLEPEMLFTLRGVDPTEMVEAAIDQPLATGKPRKGRILASDDLSSVFGVDIDLAEASSEDSSARSKPAGMARRTAQTTKKATPRKKKTKALPAAKKPASKKSADKATVREAAAKKRGARTRTRTAQPPLSAVIVEILKTRKKPLRVNEIHDALLNEKKYKTKARDFRAIVRTMLHKNENELFEKAGPGTFTLAKTKSK
jgi:uncharacterized Zn finger protein